MQKLHTLTAADIADIENAVSIAIECAIDSIGEHALATMHTRRETPEARLAIVQQLDKLAASIARAGYNQLRQLAAIADARGKAERDTANSAGFTS